MDVLHAALDVTDADAMDGFYGDFLGLEEERYAEVDGEPNYWYGGSGPAELQFRVVEDMDEPTGIHHLAIAAENIEETVEEAVEEWDSTVEIEPTEIADGVWIAFVTDPFGYTIELIEQT